MFSKILAALFIAFAIYSTNTISVEPTDAPVAERQAKLSGFGNAASQLAALEQ